MKNSLPDFETRLSVAFEGLENGLSREEILKNFVGTEKEEAEEILFIGDFLSAQKIDILPREAALRSALSAAVISQEVFAGNQWGEMFSIFWSSLFRRKILIPTLGCFLLGALVIHPIVNSPENEIERLQETRKLQSEIASEYEDFIADYQEYQKLKIDVFTVNKQGIS
jgi:hypothetical protein